MNGSIVPPASRSVLPPRIGLLDGLCRRALLRRLAGLRHGTLHLVEGKERHTFGGDGTFPLEATLTVHHPSFYAAVAAGGTVGAGEAYMEGCWSADDLTAVIRIILRNRAVLAGVNSSLARLGRALLLRLHHARRRNTPAGSRANIAAHYDLGNDFYRLFLDRTLTYSCGIFAGPETTLEEASIAKYDRICRKLGLRPEHHVLEIGTGWGGFALHAASRYGCRITTTTISREQYRLARQRIDEAGLADRITLHLTDYRELQGQYDRLVTIEMIEAVGHHYLERFLRCCADHLKPDGLMALQAITILDQVYDRYLRDVDFIKRYIFPGCCLISMAALLRGVGRSTDLRLVHHEDITPHYATTLAAWRDRFLANLPAVKALGYDEVFIRMWEFYLCYCEAGFSQRHIGDVQMILAKPLCREDSILLPLNASATGAEGGRAPA